MDKFKYTNELLINYITASNATLIGEYTAELKSRSMITFICQCGNQHSKMFVFIRNVGSATCKDCCLKNKQLKIKKTCIKKYGVENPAQSHKIQEKMRNTCIEKYGTNAPLQNKEIMTKLKNTVLNKYGVDCVLKSEVIKNNIKETLLEKYGVDHPLKNTLIKDSIRSTNLQKYGVEYPLQNENILRKVKTTNIKKYKSENVFQNEKVKEKSKKTCLEKYGVEYACQSLEIQINASKNAYKYKEYTFPNGLKIKVQGYEPFALDELIKTYKEDEIVTNRVSIPRIHYIFDGKSKYYFPDIFIPKENRIIEIKSTWTFSKKTQIIIEKCKACILSGFIIEVWVYDHKGKKQIIKDF